MVGRVESFLVDNELKRTRYTHQVSLASLTSLAAEAFNLGNKELNFEDWKQQLSSKSPTAAFCFTLPELENFLMMYVRSISQGNFKLFVSCLHDIIPSDHVHYARWLTVHIAEL